MEILITTLSIFVITGIVWFFGKFSSIKICPICAGVAGTWFWLLTGMIFGQLPITNYQLPVAILMGGSIAGIAYQTEKHFLRRMEQALLWKAIFIPLGFATVFMIVNFFWLQALIGILILKVTALFFLDFSKSEISKVSKLSPANGAGEISNGRQLTSDQRQLTSETSKLRKRKLEKEMEECC